MMVEDCVPFTVSLPGLGGILAGEQCLLFLLSQIFLPVQVPFLVAVMWFSI